jgi:hypothetical protein
LHLVRFEFSAKARKLKLWGLISSQDLFKAAGICIHNLHYFFIKTVTQMISTLKSTKLESSLHLVVVRFNLEDIFLLMSLNYWSKCVPYPLDRPRFWSCWVVFLCHSASYSIPRNSSKLEINSRCFWFQNSFSTLEYISPRSLIQAISSSRFPCFIPASVFHLFCLVNVEFFFCQHHCQNSVHPSSFSVGALFSSSLDAVRPHRLGLPWLPIHIHGFQFIISMASDPHPCHLMPLFAWFPIGMK